MPLAPPRAPAPAPAEFIPGPNVLPPAPTPLHLHDGEPVSQQLRTEVAQNYGDPSMTSLQWRDKADRLYKVSDASPEAVQVEEFYTDYGVYNKLAMGFQHGLDNVLPDKFPKIITDKASLRGRTSQGGPAWIGLEKIRESNQRSAARTVDVYDTDGTLIGMKSFRNFQELAEYIDGNSGDSHAHSAHGHGGHGAPAETLGFTGFEVTTPNPPEMPRTDNMPYAGSADGPISIAVALEQGKRIGNGYTPEEALNGLSWTAGKRDQTIKRGVMIKVPNSGLNWNNEYHMEPGVVIESTIVTPAHETKAGKPWRDDRPGGTIQKRERMVTLSELQAEFDKMAKDRHDNPGMASTNVHWELPEVAPGDMQTLSLREQELVLLDHHNLLNHPQFIQTLGNIALRGVVDRPSRSLFDPSITHHEARTLLSRPEEPGLDDRVKELEQKGLADPELRERKLDVIRLKKTVDEYGRDAVAGTAKEVLAEIHKTTDALGLGQFADQISITDILIPLIRRRTEALKHPGAPRTDGLVNADPFTYTPEGMVARRGVVDMFVAQIYNQVTLVPMGYREARVTNAAGNIELHRIPQFGRRSDIISRLPSDVATAIFDRLNKIGPEGDQPLSALDLVQAGELLSNDWISPRAFDAERVTKYLHEKQQLRAQLMNQPIPPLVSTT